jgi:uncharacterized membrane protein YuzA (DUF378 family)
MDVTKLAIGGVTVIPLIAGLVEFSKRLGLKGNWLTVEAFVLGALSAGIGGAISFNLVPALVLPWVQVAFVALAGGVAGVSASGLYDLAKRLTSARQS